MKPCLKKSKEEEEGLKREKGKVRREEEDRGWRTRRWGGRGKGETMLATDVHIRKLNTQRLTNVR